MGGGTSTNTVQASPLQDQQAQILSSLAPLIQQYGQSTMPGQTQLAQSQLSGLNSIMPNLTQMLQSAGSGAPTSADQQSLSQNFQALKKQSAQMGVPAGDPRLGQAYQQGQEKMTMGGNMPELQTIMSLFGSGQGMNAQSLLSTMGSGSPSGSKNATDPSVASQVGQGVGTAALLSYLGYLAAA